MKKLFKASVSKVYIAYLLLLTVFVIGTYSSYAYFTVNKEKKNAIKMITGNLVGELKVDGEVNDKLVVNANETKTFEVEVINKNNRQARFNFYYKGNLAENVEAGYVSGDGYNPMVKETGVNLTANGSLGYFLKYQIKVKNKTTGSITIPLGYEVGLDYNDLSLPNNCYLFEEAKMDTAADILLANYTNDESIQDYDINYSKEDKTAKENKMYVFNHEAGTQQSGWSSNELKDYRYIGKDPNNYVTFNNETAGWRIIGIETVDDGTGKKEKRIKLIRKEVLPAGDKESWEYGYVSWDNKYKSNMGSIESFGHGSSDWTDARLMMVLNPGYDNNELAIEGKGSIYWNRQSGNCPYGSLGTSTTCDFSESGLLPESQKMAGNAKWFLGGTLREYASAVNGTTDQWYSYERGEETCTTKGKCTKTRKTNWKGRVGLIYSSDYGYATSGGSTTNRDTCLKTDIYDWNNSSENIEDCKDNNWLYMDGKHQWTITSNTNYSFEVYYITGTGSITSLEPDNFRFYVARPVIYLKANTLYESGDGSESNPFVFKRDSSSDDSEPVCKFTNNSTTDFSNGGNIIVECTDDSDSISDLTANSFYVRNVEEEETRYYQNEYDVVTTLSKTENIENGKRYTFVVNKEENDNWITHCGKIFLKLKENSVTDKSGNSNYEISNEIEGVENSTCGNIGPTPGGPTTG